MKYQGPRGKNKAIRLARGLWMKRIVSCLALMLAATPPIPGSPNAAVHFGFTSAVKNTVKKLKNKFANSGSSGDIVRYRLASQTKLLSIPAALVEGAS